MTTKNDPDPRTGPKLDLEIWKRMVDELIGPGCIADEVFTAQVATERGDIQKAQMATLRGVWMLQGAANVVAKSYQDVDPEKVAEGQAPYLALLQKAKVCLHHLDKLPEELRIWQSRRE
ncbi:MAG TPA: hypothetical protein VMY40_14940 [Anaerolineae bacterium]|nr:hypothetical protein [Anaerolineae bacterium]